MAKNVVCISSRIARHRLPLRNVLLIAGGSMLVTEVTNVPYRGETGSLLDFGAANH